jgi:hypothetical protein
VSVLSVPDIVWNRACDGGGDDPRRGDKLLAAVLKFDGAALNSGVLHATEFLSDQERQVAKQGYRYFGLAAVEALIRVAEDLISSGADLGEHERALDRQYWELAAAESVLSRHFKQRYAEEPSDFSPVQ